MQVGAINSVNFKCRDCQPDQEWIDADYREITDYPMIVSEDGDYREIQDEVDSFKKTSDCEMEDIIKASRDVDHFIKSKNGKRKNPILTAASVGAGFMSLYAVGKLGSKKIVKFISEEETLSKITQKATGIASDAIQAGAIKLSDSTNKVAKFIGNKAIDVIDGATPKKLYSIAGLTTGVLGMGKVFKADGNENDIPDICEKGANAYVATLNDMGMLSSAIGVFNSLA